jgi:hypothetical protein
MLRKYLINRIESALGVEKYLDGLRKCVDVVEDRAFRLQINNVIDYTILLYDNDSILVEKDVIQLKHIAEENILLYQRVAKDYRIVCPSLKLLIDMHFEMLNILNQDRSNCLKIA